MLPETTVEDEGTFTLEPVINGGPSIKCNWHLETEPWAAYITVRAHFESGNKPVAYRSEEFWLSDVAEDPALVADYLKTTARTIQKDESLRASTFRKVVNQIHNVQG